MDLSGVISISGKSGLFKIITQSKNCVIVESFADKKRFPAFSSSQISTLEDISVFTTTEKDMPLKEVFLRMSEKEAEFAIPTNLGDEKTVKQYFLKVLPEHDTERVKFSDIKKIINWYQTLKQHDYFKDIENKNTEDSKVEETEEK